jgi:trehalose/maltose transport system substrate-binding protein
MKLFRGFLALAAVTIVAAGPARAVDMAMVSGDTGNGLQVLREILDQFEANTGNKVTIVPMPTSTTDQFGQYRLWLAAQNTDIDVYQTDVIWAPQLANQLVDLTEATRDVVGDHSRRSSSRRQ